MAAGRACPLCKGMSEARSDLSKGVMAGVGAYFVWGIVPLFWKQLASVPAWELIGHRVVWSLGFCAALLFAVRGWADYRQAFKSAASIGINLTSALLLTINWTIYVWGVNAGHIVECSLGYFLTPLFSVVLGRWLLHERLRTLQWAAFGCASAGVAWLVIASGRAPWIALGIAGSWSLYGYCRKRSPLGAVQSLAVETTLLFPLGAALLGWLAWNDRGALGHEAAGVQVLVLLTGIVTAVPLVLFAYSVRRVRLSTLGLMQFVVPTVQFLIGVLVYKEAFDGSRVVAFALIWLGVLVFITDQLLRSRTAPPPVVVEEP